MAKRKRYSAEFKRQTLRRAAEPSVIDALACEERTPKESCPVQITGGAQCFQLIQNYVALNATDDLNP